MEEDGMSAVESFAESNRMTSGEVNKTHDLQEESSITTTPVIGNPP